MSVLTFDFLMLAKVFFSRAVHGLCFSACLDGEVVAFLLVSVECGGTVLAVGLLDRTGLVTPTGEMRYSCHCLRSIGRSCSNSCLSVRSLL